MPRTERSGAFLCVPETVGASLLAKIVNDDAGSLAPSGGLGFFASKLAPTVSPGQKKRPEPVGAFLLPLDQNINQW
ncbi:hypothetical protein E1K68_04790 [Pseudomonas sp. B2021]|nr:hypothetical protein [Pseudomonas sp. B2021]OWQ41682.1 hypothetical protein CDH05_11140 [Pseudomonas lactis]